MSASISHSPRSCPIGVPIASLQISSSACALIHLPFLCNDLKLDMTRYGVDDDNNRILRAFLSSGGGFSPGKLRAMLLGVEKKRKQEEEELEAKSSLRSEAMEFEDRRASAADSCKDVECSISAEMSGSGGRRSRDYATVESIVRSQDDDSFDSESGSSGFEFQKSERAPPLPYRSPATVVPPFSRPLPSKWDDAQKWISSPTSNRGLGKGTAGQVKKGGFLGYDCRQASTATMMTKVVLEVAEADTKRMNVNQTTKDAGGLKTTLSWADPGANPSFASENPVADPAASVHNTAAFIASEPTVRSVSMRDMGTEMTPTASQEPSRTGTPVRATSPLGSPPSSQPLTPHRTSPVLPRTDAVDYVENSNKELSEKELQRKTRREIMVLGQQLGKMNIAAWASKEEEETNSSAQVKTVSEDQYPTSIIEARAAAWEEAEKAKYLARFKREEIKIQAWENHKNAKIEAEMKKIEVEVERMRARAHERLMNQLAAARHKAEEKRAAAEAKRNKQATKTAQQAEYIRRTGRIPSSFSCWSCCSWW